MLRELLERDGVRMGVFRNPRGSESTGAESTEVGIHAGPNPQTNTQKSAGSESTGCHWKGPGRNARVNAWT